MDSLSDRPWSDRLHVVTGGPGSGKTTLIEALAATGIATSAEVGRAVIREQVARGGTALPWGDERAFAALMLPREIWPARRRWPAATSSCSTGVYPM